MEFSHISFSSKYAKCSKCKLNFLVDNIIEFSKKDMTLQRFKGLGEMNTDQLWDTTLNPDTRTFLKIKISDCEAAD
ncbi:Hypothetical protein ERWE_CDS_04640 [Ehrlichia ruminantium str. Welgevonden]|uniref:DNA topoisomerase (ATP-hydrolyzing) n=1 Tax=Ehrlichia ruminantium (strain Welgevonden) TaxID=254945 RepID=A0A0H3LZC1_EHRRW|nr:Hypothetical protein ERWE_CDS_04640 [Ehrlichia ruminantium str. Welgevonden]